jgi:bifunctional ADP-heptose synthase (sugar kinase/adenylyltransferase)
MKRKTTERTFTANKQRTNTGAVIGKPVDGDAVVIFEEDTPLELVKAIMPM